MSAAGVPGGLVGGKTALFLSRQSCVDPERLHLVPRSTTRSPGSPVSTIGAADARGRSRLLHARPVLLVAFAFAVMADPVSSVAYAIEAALRALHGDLDLLLPTMGLVVALIAVVIVNYHQLVGRYPGGGGAAAAAGEAFGEAVAFGPIGALIVDFVLTIAISSAAGASAIIAYLPAAAAWRIPLALTLTVFVADLTWFGHLRRAVFALMTLGFIAVTLGVVAGGLGAPVHPTGTIAHHAGHSAPLAVAVAFPVAMALATGVEAPSSAIAQLGQLDDAGRRRFGPGHAVADLAHRRLDHAGADRAGCAPAHRDPRAGHDPDREPGQGRDPWCWLRAVPAGDRAAATLGPDFLLPGRARPAQSSGPARRVGRRGRDSARVLGPAGPTATTPRMSEC